MTKLKQKFGLIGCGYMGGALLAGVLKRRVVSPREVTVYDAIPSKARAFARRFGVRQGKTNAGVVKASGVVLLAVKPQDLFRAAAEFRAAFSARHLLLTILAGTPIAKVRRAVGPKPKIVRAMPNLAANVGEAVTAITGHSAGIARAETIFSSCGKTLRLPEKYFDLVTAVSGSGPAYFFLLMELLSKEAERHGLSKEAGRTLAVQTAVGAALLARNAPETPEELRKQVTSKGGTTEAALRVFETEGFARIVSKGVRAALRRGRELGRK